MPGNDRGDNCLRLPGPQAAGRRRPFPGLTIPADAAAPPQSTRANLLSGFLMTYSRSSWSSV
jgi:hypothetical protein